MSKLLPGRPSLEHLKNEAKELKKQSGQRLTEAQLSVAREYGFSSWASLKRHVEGFEGRRDAFFAAISAGSRSRVEELLNQDPGLVRSHNPQSFGQSAIAAAAQRSDRPMIDLLLDRGANIDERSDWWAGSFGALDFADSSTSSYLISKGASLTPHAAARLGLLDDLLSILNRNPDRIHERGGDGQFPLHFASTPEIVDLLVERGADLDARDIDHESTAAQWRIKSESVLRRLVLHGASTDIYMAVALDDIALLEKHLASDPGGLSRKTNEPGNPMIHHQAPGGPIYIYELGHCTPLQVAAHLEKHRAFDYLYQQSPPTIQFLAAVWKGDRNKALELKQHLSSLNSKEMAVIAEAERGRRHDLLRLMIELGFDLNAQDQEGMTAAHWASFHGDAEAMRMILPHKPNLEIQNVYGGTVLSTGCYGSVNGWYKSEGQFAEVVRMLLEAGAFKKTGLSGSPEVNEVLAN